MELNRMEVLVLSDTRTGSTVRILPELGFNCFEFRTNVAGQTIDVIDASPQFATGHERPSGHGIPLLFPFPNRIRGGRFSWNGRDFEIPISNASHDGAGNAIHGFCLDRPWRVTSRGVDFAVGVFELGKDAPDRLEYWPADFRIEVRYQVRGPKLRADIRLVNPSTVPLPWGFGTHPYFKLPLGAKSRPAHCLVMAPASEEWELVDCLPTGRRLPISESKDLRDGAYFDVLKMDDVLTGLPAGQSVLECGIMDEACGYQIIQQAGPAFREIVVYTPPNRNAVCLEPYTCATDAINLQPQGIDAGWRVLEPRAEFRTWIELTACEVIA
jgi:aldose 1-epimerase